VKELILHKYLGVSLDNGLLFTEEAAMQITLAQTFLSMLGTTRLPTGMQLGNRVDSI
jgi:hypothetical protein